MVHVEKDRYGIALELKAHMLVDNVEKHGKAAVVFVGKRIALVCRFPVRVMDRGADALQVRIADDLAE